MTAAENYPEIQIEYLVQKEDLDTLPYFTAAGMSYAKQRSAEEAVSVEVHARADIASVKYGRKVIETMAYLEIVHETELMRASIETSDAFVGNGIDASKYFVGPRIPDTIPVFE